MPLQAKSLGRLAGQAGDERRRQELKRAGWAVAKRAQRSSSGVLLQQAVKKGRVMTRSKKLHRIVTIREYDAAGVKRPVQDTGRAVALVQREFERRWQAGRARRIERLLDLLAAFAGRRPWFTLPGSTIVMPQVSVWPCILISFMPALLLLRVFSCGLPLLISKPEAVASLHAGMASQMIRRCLRTSV